MDCTFILADYPSGFLSSFLSKGIKTNQLEVNTDEKTLRPIARLKEPRDLFALPKDKDHDCPQQAPRWPIECQVIEERIVHIHAPPSTPEPYNMHTGDELKPRPVGEDNGLVVFNYNPISAVNYDKEERKPKNSYVKEESSDSDISSESESPPTPAECSTPDRRKIQLKKTYTKLSKPPQRPSNNSDDEYDYEELKNTIRMSVLEDKAEKGNVAKLKAFTPFSRSTVGGSKFLTNCHPYNADEYDGLEFESRFESGNLAKAVMITMTYYELYLRPDLYTSRSKQWFYFRVKRTRKNLTYRFSIVNLVKADSLYNEGMRPVMYSTINARKNREGWRRCGENIVYYRNEEDNPNEEDEDNCSYTLTWNVEFENDDDTVFFAHSYPYTYSDLQDYLMDIQKHPVKSKFCKLRLLCRSLAGNNVYYLTVTAPTQDEDVAKRKKAVVISARVHPSETPASWMMKGLMDFITGDTNVAKRLRHRFIFKLIPMLNPDGVIVGNTRNSLTGKDLNRQYRTVIRETYPSIWYTKAMIKRLIDECGVAMYCDMHAHSRKHNIFIYGCENRRIADKKLTEQVFPLMMHKNVADKFSFEGCKFKVQRNKEGTGRIVVWMLGIINSYTVEASFGGSSLASRKNTHFSTADYEHIGRIFCETLMDYHDENPAKERLRLKIIERLLKEGSSAEEPLNIPLSDYSSDEGNGTSSSENDGKGSRSFSDLEGPCCAPLKAPPCSPAANSEIRRFKFRRVRKVMHELDRIYFTPMYHKKFRSVLGTLPRNRKSNLSMKVPCVTKEKKAAQTRMVGGEVKPVNSTSQPMSKTSESDAPNTSKKPVGKVPKKNVKSFFPHEAIPKKKPKPRPKVSRVFRLWLLTKSIVIYRKQRKRRKIKMGKKAPRSKNRTPLDLPTTDPGSDIHFSSEEEDTAQSDGVVVGADRFGTVPRTRRNLLQSELQRRYIEEIDITGMRMPPELIVTSPSKTITIHSGTFPKTAPEKHFQREFPAIAEPRRTISWQNLHSGTKPVTKTSKTQSPYATSLYPNSKNDDLQLKLSLKKKVWSGVQMDNVTNCIQNRPLSWNMPTCTHQSQLPKDYPPKVATSARTGKKDEKEAFVAACSQKLLAWQNKSSGTTINEKKMSLNLVMPELQAEETYNMRTLRQTTVSRSKLKLSSKPESDGKTKKRLNPITKLAETTQFISRLAKKHSQHSHPTSKTHFAAGSNSHLPTGQNMAAQRNKFKTGGLVATAVQSTAKKGKKQRSLAGAQFGQQGGVSGGPTVIGLRPKKSIGGTMQAAVETNTIANKIKTKLRKRKSKRSMYAEDGTSSTEARIGLQ